MARVLSFLKRYFSNYYTLHRSDLAARAAPLDPRLRIVYTIYTIHVEIMGVYYSNIEYLKRCFA